MRPRLRNALPAAISPDVRMPLTTPIGPAEQLRRVQPPLPSAQFETARAGHHGE